MLIGAHAYLQRGAEEGVEPAQSWRRAGPMRHSLGQVAAREVHLVKAMQLGQPWRELLQLACHQRERLRMGHKTLGQQQHRHTPASVMQYVSLGRQVLRTVMLQG